jgi:hypothetical protein
VRRNERTEGERGQREREEGARELSRTVRQISSSLSISFDRPIHSTDGGCVSKHGPSSVCPFTVDLTLSSGSAHDKDEPHPCGQCGSLGLRGGSTEPESLADQTTNSILLRFLNEDHASCRCFTTLRPYPDLVPSLPLAASRPAFQSQEISTTVCGP